MTAGWQKIFSSDPKLGFLSHARLFGDTLARGQLPAGVQSITDASRMILNDRIDAGVAAFFLISVVVILVASAYEWYGVLTGRKATITSEIPFEPATRAA